MSHTAGGHGGSVPAYKGRRTVASRNWYATWEIEACCEGMATKNQQTSREIWGSTCTNKLIFMDKSEGVLKSCKSAREIKAYRKCTGSTVELVDHEERERET